MPSVMLLGWGLIALAVVVLGLWVVFSDDDPDEAIRGGSMKAAGGLRSGITLGRATGAGAFVVLQTLIAEFVGIGWSIFDVVGPLGASNLLAIGIGGLSLGGFLPSLTPTQYLGITLILFGIGLSSATDGMLERMA